jgi:hypothetical protein
MTLARWLAICVAAVMSVPIFHAQAEVKVVFETKDNDEANADFRFKAVHSPSSSATGTEAKFSIVDGEMDPNSGGLSTLHDGKVPDKEDQPGQAFFFRAGSDGGRILIDLGRITDIKRVATYSWHPGSRAPQVYHLFAAEGGEANFDQQPKRPKDPKECGWKELAAVDTRPKNGEPGGQCGVAIADSTAMLGRFRYLLFDMFRTENGDSFGNTFYGEIDIVGAAEPDPVSTASGSLPEQAGTEVIEVEDCRIRIDTSGTPDLRDWAHNKVGPMAKEWYPKLLKLLASDGFEAPQRVSIVFDNEMRGVAATGGARVRCAAKWFRENLEGEALGAVFHELVHVIQQYGRAPRLEGATRPPGWLVEGIADYVRWYKFEPDSHGADITARNISRARYNGSYRITANFLDWTSNTCAKELVPRLNAAIRQGKYNEAMWKEITGRDLQDLGEEWKRTCEAKVQNPNPENRNSN